MRSLILKFYGGDVFVQRIIKMLELRKQVLACHARNKKLAEALAQGQIRITGLISDYDDNRVALEQAYRLELD
jgi:hypothetical protein